MAARLPVARFPVAMAYVRKELSTPGTALLALVRGRELPVEISRLPFVAHRYVRT